jgi:hypothetical protein
LETCLLLSNSDVVHYALYYFISFPIHFWTFFVHN